MSRFKIANIIAYGFVTLFSIYVLMPILVMVLTTFKSKREIFLEPLGIPSQFGISSFEKASFRSNPDQKICDIRGKIIDTKNSPVVNITGEVVYIEKLKTGYQEFNFKETSKVSAGFPH